MNKSAVTPKPQAKGWTKPQLERLGKIADVAGPGTTAVQGQGS